MSLSAPGLDAALDTTAVVTARTGRRKAPRAKLRRKMTFDYVSFLLVFLGLPVAIFLVFVISPFIQAVYYAMTNWTGFSPSMDFVGVDNFVKLFQDPTFLQAMGNNVLLAIVVPLVTIVIALIFASMITVGGPSHGQVRGLTGSSFYRVVSFFPYVIPAIVIAILWNMIYTPSGLLNGLLGVIGIDTNGFAWLGDARTAMGATIFVIVWSMVGFYMVLFIAAIKGFPLRPSRPHASTALAGSAPSPRSFSRRSATTCRPPTSISASWPLTRSSTWWASTPPVVQATARW